MSEQTYKSGDDFAIVEYARIRERAEKAEAENASLCASLTELVEALREIRGEDRHNLPARLKVIHRIADEALAAADHLTGEAE